MKRAFRPLLGCVRPLLGCDIEDVAALRLPLLGSPKYDGIRCLVDMRGVPLSRKLKPIPSRILQKLFGDRRLAGVEGELICGTPNSPNVMQTTMSAVMSEDKDDLASRVKLYAFDYFAEPDWPYLKRLDKLCEIVARLPQPITIVKQQELTSHQEITRYEASVVDAGYEGIILRDPMGRYKYGRSTLAEQLLLKLKRFKDGEAVIIGVEELYSNQNDAKLDNLGLTKRSTMKAGMVPMSMLGAFLVRDLKTGVNFRIGGGPLLTKSARASLWKVRRTLPGQLLKYRYQPAGVKDKPRFPTAVGFRDQRDL